MTVRRSGLRRRPPGSPRAGRAGGRACDGARRGNVPRMPQRTTPGSPGPGAPSRGGGSTRGGRSGVRRRLLAVGLAVAAAGGLAGCGGQAQEVRDAGAYATRVNQVQTGFERDLRELNGVADRADVRSDVVAAVQRLDDRIVGVQRELQQIRPPAAAADAHRALIRAFGGWSAPIQQFRRALRDRSPRAARRARSAFGAATMQVEQQVTAAAQKINDALRSLSD